MRNDTIKIDRKQVKMVAHRGMSGLERENTSVAFVAAGNRSYFGIETDIQKTKDGVLVLFHDDTLDRVIGRSGKIEDLTYEELCSLRVIAVKITVIV